MELRNYWRVLVRRRLVLRNTVLIVALLSLITVAYSSYGALYEGHAKVTVHMQPDRSIKSPVTDPSQAANANTGDAVTELTSYAAGTEYFKRVSNELHQKYGVSLNWKTIQQTAKIYAVPNSHDIFIQWDGPSTAKATQVVSAATDQLVRYIPVYQALANTPRIDYALSDPPTAQRVSLTKPLFAFLERVAVGIVLGIILAYLFEYLDDSVQDEADVRHWMHVPTLAVIPGGRHARRTRSA